MLYTFGDDYTLDPTGYELRQHGRLVRLEPRVFDLVAYLVQHPDRTVTKEELLAQLWPQQFVTDASLTYCVAQARKALGDTGQIQRSIQTVRRRGYRFISPVNIRPQPEAAAGGLPPAETPLPAVQQPLGGRLARIPTVAALPALTVASEGAWEHKPVAVLAIELTWPGSTEPEAVGNVPWRVTAAWQHTIAEQVQRWGGVVLQRAPSLLLVAFGTPQTLEQLPQRAVQAALALRQLVVEPADRVPCPEVRVVGHWGPLLVDVQAPDPTTAHVQALGETLAWPVRLFGHIAPGEIVVSRELGDLVVGWYELEAREVALAGRPARHVRVYAVQGPKPPSGWLELSRQRPLSRFVGRDQELTLLHSLMALAAEGRGQVVGLIGEPGMGKTRLCYECTARHLAPPWALRETRAMAYSQAIPYFPITELLRASFQLDARDRAPTIRHKVTASLLALDAELQPMLSAFLTLLDVPVEEPAWQALAPHQRRQRLLEAVKCLLIRVSQAQPLLVIVENLHWIDTETQACLDSLVESVPTARLLLLVTYRPEYRHGWGHKTYYTQLRLDPLSHAHAQALLDALLGDEDSLAPLKRHVLAQTQGNPFFVEESVQTLIETGGVVGERGAYRLGPSRQTLRVPATIQAVLAARIDRLPPEAKYLLQTAAVIGTDLPFSLLQAIADVPEEALHSRLSHLQAAEFLYGTRLFPELEYTFKHALIHEVAYGSLLQERRRTLHARAIEALETLPEDQMAMQVERLAHHALRGEVWDKALVYCRQAGDKAMVRSAHRESVGYVEQALSALPHLPETRATREQAIDLRLALRSALLPSADHERILTCLREAETLAEALDDSRRLARVSRFLSNYFVLMGMYDQAITAAQRAMALATASHDGVLCVQANSFLGLAYWAQGHYGRAMDCLSQAMRFFERERRHALLGDVLAPAVLACAYLVACHAERGTFAKGSTLGDEGLRIAEAVAHPPSLMMALWGASMLALRQGDLPGALSRLERAMRLCQDANLPFYFPRLAAALGEVYTLSGRVADALPLLTQAIAQSAATERARVETICSLPLGAAYRRADHLEEARTCAERALARARERQEHGRQAYALHLLGEIAVGRDPLESDKAKEYYLHALALAKELEMRPLQAHCHRSLGTLYATTGQREQACTELSAAIALYRAIDMTFWLPQAEAALAQVEER